MKFVFSLDLCREKIYMDLKLFSFPILFIKPNMGEHGYSSHLFTTKLHSYLLLKRKVLMLLFLGKSEEFLNLCVCITLIHTSAEIDYSYE